MNSSEFSALREGYGVYHKEGGLYFFVGLAKGASADRGKQVVVYRDHNGLLYFRQVESFQESFTPANRSAMVSFASEEEWQDITAWAEVHAHNQDTTWWLRRLSGFSDAQPTCFAVPTDISFDLHLVMEDWMEVMASQKEEVFSSFHWSKLAGGTP